MKIPTVVRTDVLSGKGRDAGAPAGEFKDMLLKLDRGECLVIVTGSNVGDTAIFYLSNEKDRDARRKYSELCRKQEPRAWHFPINDLGEAFTF